MKKITFERAVLAVFILIILISTSSTTLKYINRGINKISKASKAPVASTNTNGSLGFPTLLMNANNLYKEGDFEGAADKYLALALNNALSLEQKAHVYFRLGICQYKLKKYDLATNS
ncbi:MAG: hypothetical protein K0Q65_2684, partial [Clostridia bacterium]|nr:hypothetical protein [Clostridia bacterium]